MVDAGGGLGSQGGEYLVQHIRVGGARHTVEQWRLAGKQALTSLVLGRFVAGVLAWAFGGVVAWAFCGGVGGIVPRIVEGVAGVELVGVHRQHRTVDFGRVKVLHHTRQHVQLVHRGQQVLCLVSRHFVRPVVFDRQFMVQWTFALPLFLLGHRPTRQQLLPQPPLVVVVVVVGCEEGGVVFDNQQGARHTAFLGVDGNLLARDVPRDGHEGGQQAVSS